MIIALTGNIGSGKTLAAGELQKSGARIIDADLLSRQVVEPGSAGLSAVVAKFGEKILDKQGHLNRKALALLIFNDPVKRKALEDILHPLIRKLFLVEIEANPPKANELVVYVIPLFFESRFTYPEVQRSVLIACPKEDCIQRIVTRDGLNYQEALARYDAQLPLEQKIELADFVIWNNGSVDEFISKIRSFKEELIKQLS